MENNENAGNLIVFRYDKLNEISRKLMKLYNTRNSIYPAKTNVKQCVLNTIAWFRCTAKKIHSAYYIIHQSLIWGFTSCNYFTDSSISECESLKLLLSCCIHPSSFACCFRKADIEMSFRDCNQPTNSSSQFFSKTFWKKTMADGLSSRPLTKRSCTWTQIFSFFSII